MLSFCVSVGLTAMVGGVYATYQYYLYPQFAFDPLVTIGIVLMTFFGGRATLWGPVLGAFVLKLSQQYFAFELGGQRFYLIAYALVFLIVMLFMPRGILPSIQERLRFRRARSASPSDPSPGDPPEPPGRTSPTTPVEVNGA
jgi:branched-chain amino acid transport system permease protein